MSKGTARVLQWGVGLALVVLFLVLADTSELGRLVEVSWPWLMGVLLATAGLVLSAAARWRMIAIRVVGGGAVSLRQYVYYFLVGRVLGFVLPAEVTDVGVRTLALKRSESLSLAGAAYTVLLDRLFDFLVLVWLVIPGVFHLSGLLSQRAALTIGFAGIALVPWVVGRRHGAAVRGLTRLFARLLAWVRLLPWAREAAAPELREETTLGARASGAIYLLSVVKLAMVVARFYCVAGALSVAMPAPTAVLCVPLAQLAALVAVTPGGMGILEMGWYGILSWAGLSGDETVLLVFGWRLYSFISLLLLALGLRVGGFVWDRGR